MAWAGGGRACASENARLRDKARSISNTRPPVLSAAPSSWAPSSLRNGEDHRVPLSFGNPRFSTISSGESAVMKWEPLHTMAAFLSSFFRFSLCFGLRSGRAPVCCALDRESAVLPSCASEGSQPPVGASEHTALIRFASCLRRAHSKARPGVARAGKETALQFVRVYVHWRSSTATEADCRRSPVSRCTQGNQ